MLPYVVHRKYHEQEDKTKLHMKRFRSSDRTIGCRQTEKLFKKKIINYNFTLVETEILSNLYFFTNISCMVNDLSQIKCN